LKQANLALLSLANPTIIDLASGTLYSAVFTVDQNRRRFASLAVKHRWSIACMAGFIAYYTVVRVGIREETISAFAGSREIRTDSDSIIPAAGTFGNSIVIA
jgi:hypothetical protein